MTTPNTELAYKVLDHIDANPETWNQDQWWCATGGCFAGWAVTLAGATLRYDEERGDAPFVVAGPIWMLGMSTSAAARAALGIQVGAALFSPDNTREDLGEIVAEIFGPRPGGAA